MEPGAFDYVAGAAGDERTLAENRNAFERIVFRPRVLVDVTQVKTATSLLGASLSLPVMLAPTALNRLAHPDGEIAAARAAKAAGTVMIVSTTASSAIEDVADAAPGALWFQLYVYRDRELTRDLVQRAEASGCRALVLTVDMPRMGRRERDIRNAFRLPEGIRLMNLETSGRPEAAAWSAGSSFAEYVHSLLDPSLTWDAIAWLKSLTALPVLVKGILAPDDAARASEAGAAGIVVSNHGGRQLDGAIATIDALPEIAERVDGRIPILLDGGIRRGADVVKALAFGARAVLIGRPYLWGLAASGEAGVARVIQILRTELELALALVGCPDVTRLDRSFALHRPRG
jgi:4-hydroxymandelate oxidase